MSWNEYCERIVGNVISRRGGIMCSLNDFASAEMFWKLYTYEK